MWWSQCQGLFQKLYRSEKSGKRWRKVEKGGRREREVEVEKEGGGGRGRKREVCCEGESY